MCPPQVGVATAFWGPTPTPVTDVVLAPAEVAIVVANVAAPTSVRTTSRARDRTTGHRGPRMPGGGAARPFAYLSRALTVRT
jgi:hypothetical protein